MTDSCDDRAAKLENIPEKGDSKQALNKLQQEVANTDPQERKSVFEALKKQNQGAAGAELPGLTIAGPTDPAAKTADCTGKTDRTGKTQEPAVKTANGENQRFWHGLAREWLGLPDGASQDQVARACEAYGKGSSMNRFYDQLRSDPKYASEVRGELQLPSSASQKEVDQAFEKQRSKFAAEMGLPENASRVLMDDLATYADQKETARKLGLPALDLRAVDAAGGSRDMALEARENHINQAIQFADLNNTLEKMGEKPVDMNKIPEELRFGVLQSNLDRVNMRLNSILKDRVSE
jgi:hypothetical protein